MVECSLVCGDCGVVWLGEVCCNVGFWCEVVRRVAWCAVVS